MARDASKKKWTVMVYLSGDNNLSSAGSVDLTEMKQAGSTGELNVIARSSRWNEVLDACVAARSRRPG